jgi:predicted hydrolase (HD superfamily)
MLTRQEFLRLVDRYISSADKRKHVVAVSAIMKSLAEASAQRKTREVGLDVLKKVFESESFPVFLKNGILTCKGIGLTLEQFLQLALTAIPNNLIINSSDL